ncbi:lytic transglycosylase domain-containing protein [Rhodocytophaga rosea]|uniref:Lytic transglycosylase domain-containing protein n=1 Tax=Rhodocytophaga rosea TaxID=2704465 RepID=A0A6C0GIR3_9BACT|nr:lytic transglycosylase domain-containing protein [Rhodocytophaga rosea]QHT67936.1 lytic transglycosylase domain-containing protein [Rhodocytophaga rosea]
MTHFRAFIFLWCLSFVSVAVYAQDGTVSQKISTVPLPSELYFAGEKVPLNDVEVRERLERELIINCYRHSTTLIILKRVYRWREKMEAILVEQGIPTDFFYLAVIESELEPYADSGKAHGFWQFTDGSAKAQRLEISKYVDQRRDPILSTKAAARHIKSNYDEFKSWTLAAAAYNLGMPTLRRVRNYQEVNSYYDLYLTSETARYVFRILAMKLIIENPEKYGFYLKGEDKLKPMSTKAYKVDHTIDNIAKFALDQKINYKILKLYNPWIKFDSKDDYNYRFEVLPGKSYEFQLPVQ